MGNTKVLLRFVVLLLAIGSQAGWAQPSDVVRLVEALRGNAVVVQTNFAGAQQLGFGVVTSSSQGEFVVATAGHVVFQDPPPTSINVQLGSQSWPATIIRATSESNGDLAFLKVKGKPNPAWGMAIGSYDALVPGERVWLYGFQNQLAFKGEGKIVQLNRDTVLLTGLGGWDGSSGAPVYGSTGLVGIYLGTDGIGSGKVRLLSSMRDEARQHRIPWSLEQALWSARTLKLDLRRTDQLSVAVKARHLRSRTEYIPGVNNAQSGEYALVYPANLLSCNPAVFVADRDQAEKRIDISCSPNLLGDWKNARVHMNLVQLGDSEYIVTSTGSQQDHVAWFAGRLMQDAFDPLLFRISAKGMMQQAVLGTVKFSQDLKTATVKTTSTSPVIQESLERQ